MILITRASEVTTLWCYTNLFIVIIIIIIGGLEKFHFQMGLFWVLEWCECLLFKDSKIHVVFLFIV